MAIQEEILRLKYETQGVDQVTQLNARLADTRQEMVDLKRAFEGGSVTADKYHENLRRLHSQERVIQGALRDTTEEVQKTTLAIGNYTIAVHQAAQKGVVAGQSMGRSGNLAQGMLQLGYIADDLQYGFAAIVNNLGGVAAMAGPWGAAIAGGVTIAAVAANTLYRNWDKVEGLFADEETSREAERMKALAEQTERAAAAEKQMEDARKARAKFLQEKMGETEKARAGVFGEIQERVGPAQVRTEFERAMREKEFTKGPFRGMADMVDKPREVQKRKEFVDAMMQGLGTGDKTSLDALRTITPFVRPESGITGDDLTRVQMAMAAPNMTTGVTAEPIADIQREADRKKQQEQRDAEDFIAEDERENERRLEARQRAREFGQARNNADFEMQAGEAQRRAGQTTRAFSDQLGPQIQAAMLQRGQGDDVQADLIARATNEIMRRGQGEIGRPEASTAALDLVQQQAEAMGQQLKQQLAQGFSHEQAKMRVLQEMLMMIQQNNAQTAALWGQMGGVAQRQSRQQSGTMGNFRGRGR
jgi:hypothetical protein